MNTDACNVEDKNISHIFEDCFAFFALDHSFTLCKNDLDPNDNSDSASA